VKNLQRPEIVGIDLIEPAKPSRVDTHDPESGCEHGSHPPRASPFSATPWCMKTVSGLDARRSQRVNLIIGNYRWVTLSSLARRLTSASGSLPRVHAGLTRVTSYVSCHGR
jgi:hypothetical protein